LLCAASAHSGAVQQLLAPYVDYSNALNQLGALRV
jgi:hypothetical protein